MLSLHEPPRAMLPLFWPDDADPADARRDLAASTAALPVTVEMAWAVPQLLKRARLVSPGVASTSGVLRALIRMPECDEQFATAFADSGFLSCDQVIGRVRWKYDLAEMATKHRDGSAAQVLEHCRTVLANHRARQPFDWDAALAELRKLNAWFPGLRTIALLEQLYTRLHMLHLQSVFVARCWLEQGPKERADA